MKIVDISLENLVCPRDKQPFQMAGQQLVCAQGHHYPIVDGIPIMLIDDVAVTHPVITESLQKAKQHYQLPIPDTAGIPEFIQSMIAGTNGNLYLHLIGRLTTYPIPVIRLPTSNGKTLLDLGCGWGRWSISAARKGYQVVGIDPSIDAVFSARYASQQLGLSIQYLVADARYLPFKANFFDVAFSYSVLQHFSKGDAVKVLHECYHVLKPNGQLKIQLPNIKGVRNSYNRWRSAQVTPQNDPFQVRYWSLAELKQTFSEIMGETDLSIDGFFGLGIQPSDIELMPTKYKAVIYASESLRRLAAFMPWLINFADSIYVDSCKSK